MASTNIQFVVYDTTTGYIKKWGTCQAENINTKGTGVNEAVLQVPGSGRDHYVLNGQLTNKTTISATWDKQLIQADGIDTATLSNLPDPVTLSIDFVPTEIVGGVLEFTASDPGTYHIWLDVPEYFREEWEIVAE